MVEVQMIGTVADIDKVMKLGFRKCIDFQTEISVIVARNECVKLIIRIELSFT